VAGIVIDASAKIRWSRPSRTKASIVADRDLLRAIAFESTGTVREPWARALDGEPGPLALPKRDGRPLGRDVADGSPVF
jgi:hypothetical protein